MEYSKKERNQIKGIFSAALSVQDTFAKNILWLLDRSQRIYYRIENMPQMVRELKN